MSNTQTIETNYGKTGADWVARWDAGDIIWTIDMGGMGPGYEQALQTAAVEMVRWFVKDKTDPAIFADEEEYPKLRDRMDDELFNGGPLSGMGLSGAQVGAARNLACFMYRDGPESVMADDRVKDRHIMISNKWPGKS